VFDGQLRQMGIVHEVGPDARQPWEMPKSFAVPFSRLRKAGGQIP
jgi:hypothetical protein